MLRLIMHMFTGSSVKLGSRKFSYGKNTVKNVREGVKPCSYPTFARGYKGYTVNKNYTSHVEHKPGVTLEARWSGPTMSYIDPDKNKECTAYLFVATFPYSQYNTLKLQLL